MISGVSNLPYDATALHSVSSPVETVTVSKSGSPISDYTSVAAAVNSILDANPTTKPYIVRVAAGVYVEPPFTLQPGITVIGEGSWSSVILQTNDNAEHFITGAANSRIANISIIGPTGAGYSCIHMQEISAYPMLCDRIEILSGYYGFLCDPLGGSSSIVVSGCSCVVSSGMNCFTKVGADGLVNIQVGAVAGVAPGALTTGFCVDGVGARLTLDLVSFNSIDATDGVMVDNGAIAELNSCRFEGGINALHMKANGVGSQIDASSCAIGDLFTKDIWVESATSILSFEGVAHNSKITINAGATAAVSFSDDTVGSIGRNVRGELYVSTATDSLAIASYLREVSQTGEISGGEITRRASPNLTLDVVAGTGYISLTTSNLTRIAWSNTALLLTANQQYVWIYVDSTQTVKFSTVKPDFKQNIILGVACTNANDVVFLATREFNIYNRAANQAEYFKDAIGSINVSGGALTKHTTPSIQFDIENSVYYIYNNRKTSADFVGGSSFTYWYKNGANWISVPGCTSLDTNNYNDTSSGLVALVGGKFKRDQVYVCSNDTDTQVHVVYGQTEFAAAGLALTDPTPPEFLRLEACRIGALVVEGAGTDILTVYDELPRLGQNSPYVSAVTDHGALTGLLNDTHTQYQLRSEEDALNGYCGLDASGKIVASKLYLSTSAPPQIEYGAAAVGASTLLAREDHGHSVGVGTPVAVNVNNNIGAANTLSRSDHVHAHGNQTVGTLHAAVISGSTNGFMTGADKAILDAVPSTYTPLTRNLIAGNGLTGGGTLASDRTFTVSPHADGSILAGVGGVQVGILASDSQHGNRGGSTLHAVAIAGGANGFMSGTDKTKLDGIEASATNTPLASLVSPAVDATAAALGSSGTVARQDHTHLVNAGIVGEMVASDASSANAGTNVKLARIDHKHTITTGTPVSVGTANDAGVATTLAKSDHIHQSALLQTVFKELTVDATNANTIWTGTGTGVLLSEAVTTITGSKLLIHFTCGTSSTTNNRTAYFRVVVDSVVRRAIAVRLPTLNEPNSVSICLVVTGLSSGGHNVNVEWRMSGGTGQVRPIAAPDQEHASLVIQEILY